MSAAGNKPYPPSMPNPASTTGDPMYPSSSVLAVERGDHVATVWLDRPDKLNALGPQAWRDLPAVMEGLGSDDDVRVVVIAAKGKAFTVGIDLVAFGPSFTSGAIEEGGEPGTVAARRADYDKIRELQHTFTSIARCPKPVIARVHGAAIGGGVGLVAACDLAVAVSKAVFCLSEVKLGIIPAVISPYVLEKIGPGLARRYALTACS